MKIKVYISGAISGLSYNEAKDMFDQAQRNLSKQNFEVVNPFDNGLDNNSTWAEHMRMDIKALLDCDCIYMLKTWKSSKGSILEHKIADELGMVIIYESE